MKSIEENCSKKLSSKTRLYFLLEFVKSLNHDDYFYVRKLDDIQLLELPFDNNEGDADVAYNEIIRFYYLQGGSVFSPKTIFLNPFRPPELKHKTNKGAPQKVVAKPCKPLQILRTLQSNSQNETNTFASEKRNTKRTRNLSEIQKYISINLLFV
ncbi:hypothetical protein RhiirA1_541803 [Rhizophagus irregularis]|uniref:Uncharacterized protein n=1 Tax=Rhizophagus irregularis TaxID=588596 RepID=A0A2N0R174_9GLOM|nr:hypothetical protein RhiirA1_541803 [Rhizophagus irregularis]